MTACIPAIEGNECGVDLLACQTKKNEQTKKREITKVPSTRGKTRGKGERNGEEIDEGEFCVIGGMITRRATQGGSVYVYDIG